MILLNFIVKYIPFDTIYIWKGGEPIAMINGSCNKRTRKNIKVYNLPIFGSGEIDESLRFAILNSTNFMLRSGSNYIEVILND